MLKKKTTNKKVKVNINDRKLSKIKEEKNKSEPFSFLPEDESVTLKIYGHKMSLLEIALYVKDIAKKAEKSVNMKEYLILETFLDIMLKNFQTVGREVGEELEKKTANYMEE